MEVHECFWEKSVFKESQVYQQKNEGTNLTKSIDFKYMYEKQQLKVFANYIHDTLYI